jgi:hypothetical protein
MDSLLALMTRVPINSDARIWLVSIFVMKEPDIPLPDIELLGMAGEAGAVVVLELPEDVDGDAGACANAGAANMVATRQAAMCVLSIVNSFW